MVSRLHYRTLNYYIADKINSKQCCSVLYAVFVTIFFPPNPDNYYSHIVKVLFLPYLDFTMDGDDNWSDMDIDEETSRLLDQPASSDDGLLTRCRGTIFCSSVVDMTV